MGRLCSHTRIRGLGPSFARLDHREVALPPPHMHTIVGDVILPPPLSALPPTDKFSPRRPALLEPSPPPASTAPDLPLKIHLLHIRRGSCTTSPPPQTLSHRSLAAPPPHPKPYVLIQSSYRFYVLTTGFIGRHIII
jgi:hypothetical protein